MAAEKSCSALLFALGSYLSTTCHPLHPPPPSSLSLSFFFFLCISLSFFSSSLSLSVLFLSLCGLSSMSLAPFAPLKAAVSVSHLMTCFQWGVAAIRRVTGEI